MTETLGATDRPSRSRKTPDRPCLNCGDPTPGNFCRTCGQRKVEVRITLRRMLLEALDDQFSLNSALPRTLGALFFRPGHLTREYMAGRIARYIPPFRLYLVSSVVFFLVLSFTLTRSDSLRVAGPTATADSASVTAATRDGAAADSAARPRDSLAVRAGADSAAPGRDAIPAPPRNWLGNVNIRSGSAQLDSVIRGRVDELGRMEPRVALRRVADRMLDYLPQTMFLLLPVFALVLKLLYLGSRRLYVEHFVFALHLHAFTFACFTAETLIDHPVVETVVGSWVFLYTYLAMYRFYGQNWFLTGIKYLSLGLIYLILLTIAFTGTLIAAVALM